MTDNNAKTTAADKVIARDPTVIEKHSFNLPMTAEQRKEKRQQFMNKAVDLLEAAETLYSKAYTFVKTENIAVFKWTICDMPGLFRRVQRCLDTAKKIFRELGE